jgi:hypothetical protein
MANPYRVIVTTSDKYLPVLRLFVHQYHKYWNPHAPVLIAGYAQPEFDLPEYMSFVSLGEQKDYPFPKWSNALIALLRDIEDEVIVLMLDDYLLARPVDTRNVQILADYARQFGYVLKIDLCADRLYAYGADLNYGTVGHIDLIKSMPGSPYHMSLWPGIWRRDNLLRVLVPNESPHDIELIGTTRLSHIQDLLVLGTRNMPLQIALGLRGGNSTNLNTSELQPQDVEALRGLGYLQYWEKQDG